jgi:hypothetical protein
MAQVGQALMGAHGGLIKALMGAHGGLIKAKPSLLLMQSSISTANLPA